MGGCRVLAVWCAAGQPKDRPGCERRRMTHRAHDIVPSGTSKVKPHLRDVAVAIATLSPPEERNRRQGVGGQNCATDEVSGLFVPGLPRSRAEASARADSQ